MASRLHLDIRKIKEFAALKKIVNDFFESSEKSLSKMIEDRKKIKRRKNGKQRQMLFRLLD